MMSLQRAFCLAEGSQRCPPTMGTYSYIIVWGLRESLFNWHWNWKVADADYRAFALQDKFWLRLIDWDLCFRIYTDRQLTKVSGTYLLKSPCGGYEPQNVSSNSWWWRWRWWWLWWGWWRRWSGAQVEEVLTTYLLNPAVSVISCTTSGLSVPFMQHWVSITDSH